MCGIGGFTGPPRPALLQRLIDRLAHRGPDGQGVWWDARASLAMRRLAIVDLAAGEQPFFNETRTIAVVFNGEIYNHRQLRAALEKQGHRFRTDHADGEILPHLYEQYGVNFLQQLLGMFAIALWDQRDGSLLLARDAMGIKPLYYARPGGRELAFASEPKGLLTLPEVGRQPDLPALHHYFSFKHIPAPHSAFAQIRQLAAGEWLRWQDGAIQVQRWWHLPGGENSDIDEPTAAATIRHLLRQSVESQMAADVPIGAYLSGGVDSSAVVALLREAGAGRIATFTLVYDETFPGKQADQQFARMMAERCGVERYEHLLTQQEIIPALEQVVAAFDEPFSGVISTFFLTGLIGRHVKVALSGDGADELFGSYLPHRLAQPLAALEQWGDAAPPESLAPFDRQRPFLAAILARGDEAARRMGQYIADDAANLALYTPTMAQAVAAVSSRGLIADILAACPSRDPLNRMLYLDQATLLPDQVLTFVDRLSMAHGVEVRPPFLDQRLVAFVATLPGSMKIRHGRVKHILKEALAPLLPAAVLQRPKEGFLMPVNAWLLAGLRPLAESLLSRERLARHGLLDGERVAQLLAAHYAGAADHGNRLWNLLMFQLWWDRYQQGGDP